MPRRGALACSAQSEPMQDLTHFRGRRWRLSIATRHTDRTPIGFEVWIADTPARAEQGLMFVSDLPESSGMVFPLTPPRVERMWMKKHLHRTRHAVRQRRGAQSAKIAPRAQPLKLDTLSSDAPVSAVVELRAARRPNWA